jgi:hypothetical protein
LRPCARRPDELENPAVASAEPEAIATGRGCKISSGETFAATRVARLWRDQDKLGAAPELLARVYSWFTEGLDALDLKEAKPSLNGLSA